MGGKVGTDLGDLLGEVAKKGRGAVGGGGWVEADEVGVGTRVSCICEGGDGAEAVGFVVIT